MALNWPAKDPDEVLDYTWSPALSQGDHIVSATATRISGTVALDATAHNNTSVTLTLSGGTDAQTSAFQIRVTTHGDYVLEETIYITCAVSANSDVAAFKRRHPAFAAVDNETIAAYMTDAIADVGDIGDDTARATYLLAAHYMTLNGIGATTEAQLATNGASGMSRLKSASFEIELKGADAKSNSALARTNYGQQFMALWKRHRGALLTGTGTWPVNRAVAPWGY